MEDEGIECPVCDRRIDPEATVCPGCGTDFCLHDMDELRAVVCELDRPTPAAEVPAAECTAAKAAPAPVEEAEPSERKGLLSKWLKRR